MALNEFAEIVTWPPTHYVYIERSGPFQETAPKAWTELHALMDLIAGEYSVVGMMSLYKTDPEMIYRAGAILSHAVTELPPGMQYLHFEGGKYTRYTLNGSYSQLPQASGRVFQLIKESNLDRRDDFNIEQYVNDPRTTAEEDLITHILIPTK